MFICTELTEETGRPPGLIFRMAVTSLNLRKNFTHLTEL